MEQHHKSNAKKSGNDVRDEHGAKVKSRLGEKRFTAIGAMLFHLKRLLERKSRRGKKVTFSTLRALQPQHSA
jgi:hypothetical protein